MARSYEIAPLNVSAYPGDRLQFTVRGTPTPVYWYFPANVEIQSDYSLLLDNPSNPGGADGAYFLNSGIGKVKFTIDDNCRPTGGAGRFKFYIELVDAVNNFRMLVEVAATQILIKNEDGTTLDTISHSIASSDTLEIELAGEIFRFYLNGTLETEYAFSAAATAVGAFFSVQLTPTVAGATPTIPQPIVSGDWRADFPAWDGTSDGGSLSATTDNPVTYTAGTIPGVYTLTVAPVNVAGITGDELETETATIIIPPLSILGETSVTLQPSAKARFQTNYDAAQSRIVTWSVVSGSGSFSNGEFTAPSAPGTTVVKATSGNQIAEVTITIPVVMTITTPGNLATTAAKLGEILTLTTNLTGTVTWSADIGSITGSPGATVTWTAPNQRIGAGERETGALITATNGTLTIKQEIFVLKDFPYATSRNINWQSRKTVLASRAEDRSRRSVVKDYNNLAFESFELPFINRNQTEFQAAKAFHAEHYPGLKFIYEDVIQGARKVVFFDSDLAVNGYMERSIDYSVRVIEA